VSDLLHFPHRTNAKLEKSLKGKYLVAVSATDPGDLSSDTVLEVSDIMTS